MREYYVTHVVRMEVTELVRANTRTEAIERAQQGEGEAVGSEALPGAFTTAWRAVWARGGA